MSNNATFEWFMNESPYFNFKQPIKSLIVSKLINYVADSNIEENYTNAIDFFLQKIHYKLEELDGIISTPLRTRDGRIDEFSIKKKLIEELSSTDDLQYLSNNTKVSMNFNVLFPIYFYFFNQNYSQEALNELFQDCSIELEEDEWKLEIKLLIDNFIYNDLPTRVGKGFNFKKNFLIYSESSDLIDLFLNNLISTGTGTISHIESFKTNYSFCQQINPLEDLLFRGNLKELDISGMRISMLKKRDINADMILSLMDDSLSLNLNNTLLGKHMLLYLCENESETDNMKELLLNYVLLNKENEGPFIPLIQLVFFDSFNFSFLEEFISSFSKQDVEFLQPMLFQNQNLIPLDLNIDFFYSNELTRDFHQLICSNLGASLFLGVLPASYYEILSQDN